MKTITHKKKVRKTIIPARNTGIIRGARVWAILFAFLGTVMLSSCLKDGDETPETVAAVQVVNAVPGSTGLVLALDNNQLNNLGAGEYFEYGKIMPYRRVYPGERLLRVFHPQDVADNEEILRENITFDVGEFYSLFVVGTTDLDMDVVRVADSLDAVVSGKSMIRFINLSPDAPVLELRVSGRDTPMATGIAFKGHSDYVELTAGTEYQFIIRRVGNPENLYEFEFTPKDRYIYTFCAKGLFSELGEDDDSAFDHGVIVH